MQPHSSEVQRRWAENNRGLDVSPMEVVALLKRIDGVLDRVVEPLYEGAPLTSPELELLIPLRFAEEPVIARRLADTMGLSRAAISKALARLERRGHVRRDVNPADRRAALVTITDSGRAAIDMLFPRQLAAEAVLFEGLGEKRAQVLDALDDLLHAMEQGAARLGEQGQR